MNNIDDYKICREVYEDWKPGGIASLTIGYYRSFYQKQKINFAIPNGKAGSGLTLIVGENNSGKSNIIEVIKKLEMYEKHHDINNNESHKNHKSIFIINAIDNHYEDPQEIEKVIKHQGDRKIFKYKVIEKIGNEIKKGKNYTNYHLLEGYPGWREFVPVDINRKISYMLNIPNKQKLENSRICWQYLVDDRGHKGDVSLGTELFSKNYWQVIKAIEEEKKEEFNELIKRIFPDFQDWFIEVKNKKYNLIYQSKPGEMHRFDYLGSGVMSIFKILSAIFIKAEIPIIDEPEMYLHPQARKGLARIFSEESKFNQTIIITHDPIFINFKDIENGAQVVRIALDKNGKSKVYNLSREAIEPILKLKNDWRKPYLLDYVAKEIFFSRNVVFVEGQEDKELIAKFITDNSIETNFDIFGYGAGCAGNISKFLQLTKDLNINAGAILDGDGTGRDEKEKCKGLFKRQFLIIQHSKDDIRDKPQEVRNDKIYKKKIGLFNDNGKIKGSNESEELKSIIKKLNNFFQKKLTKTLL